MATKYTAFARHRLVTEVKVVSQNISTNQTSLKGELFLQSVDAYGAIYASAVGQAKVTVDGKAQTENANSNLSANQKKILLSKIYVVTHDNAGNKNPVASASYYVNVTFAGVYYGTVSVGNFNVGALPTIPRHSSLNAIPTFSVPNGCSFSISRKSNFTHKLSFYIQTKKGATLTDDSQWTWIMDVNNIATGGTFNFSEAQMKTISARLSQFDGAMQGKVKLWTNGVSGLSAQRTVQITSPTSAVPSLEDFVVQPDLVLNIGLSNVNSNTRFKYDILIADDSVSWGKRFNDKRESFSYTLTKEEANLLETAFTNSTTRSLKFFAIPKLDGIQYRGNHNVSLNMMLDPVQYSPTIQNTFRYEDTSPIGLSITKDKTAMIQSVSNLKVAVANASIQAKGSSTISTVDVTFGGKNKNIAYTGSDLVFDMGTVSTGVSSPLTIRVTDSRGLTAVTSKTVSSYPYTSPIIDMKVGRANNFDADIKINGKINYTPMPSTFNYSISKVTYSTNTGIPETNLTITKKTNSYEITPDTFLIPTNSTGTVTIKVYDNIGTVSRTFNITKGKPILFINSKLETVSIGNLTRQGYNGTLPGYLELESEIYHTSGKTGIQMNNSDISGVNGIWFSTDPSTNDGEGLHFLRTGAEANVIGAEFYDRIYMRDGGVYINSDSTPIFNVNSTGSMMYNPNMLWQGDALMVSTQIATPSKPISTCRNGWVLVWASGSSGADSSETYINKATVARFSGEVYRTLNMGAYNKVIGKLLYLTDTQIKGHDRNGEAVINGNAARLQGVYEW